MSDYNGKLEHELNNENVCGIRASIDINTLRPRPRQNGRHFANDIFKRIFLNENV